ncbi:hypothetical protein PG994_003629 [Apiospora phragmitis]|uniref:O-methyltransferase dimerisation domain-containing protein n=1 Tax=Apiospora phragmitis TaxID=2905665 RepID=A0ABR1VZY0_9PEZI
MTFAEAQTWGPLELFGAGVACEMGIFDVLAKHSGALSTADIARELNADPALLARILRLLDVHYMVDQVSLGQYAANAITRDYTQPYRKGNVMTQIGLMPSYFALPTWLRANDYKVLPDASHCGWQVGANTTETFWESMSKDPSLGKFFFISSFPLEGQRDNKEKRKAKLILFSFSSSGGGLGHQAKRIRGALPPSRGRVILQDLRPSKNVTRFDLSMLASVGGAQRSEAEQKALLESVGLEVVGNWSTPREWSIMEARLKSD